MRWRDIFHRNREAESPKETVVSDDIVPRFPKPSDRLASVIREVPSICEVLYLYKQRSGISKEWIWWALDMVEKGLQTPGILQLAGEDLTMNPFEFLSLAETIFQELELDVNNDDAYYQYALWVAHQALDGVITAEEGFKKLYYVALDTRYNKAFMEFYYRDEDAYRLRNYIPSLCSSDDTMREDNIEEWMHLFFEKLIKFNE